MMYFFLWVESKYEKEQSVSGNVPNVISRLCVHVTGFCPEYSILAGRVQENYDVDCKKFKSPCPSFFMSTDAYKREHIHVDILYKAIPTKTNHTLENAKRSQTRWEREVVF